MLTQNRKYFSKTLLALYLFLLGVSSLHQHNFHFEKFETESFSEKQNFNDPFLDDVGKCTVQHFFNSSFQINVDRNNFNIDSTLIEILIVDQHDLRTTVLKSQISPRAPPTIS
ncbi:MAG: hypothetical protein AB1521_12120 [Bacteroidota bacterium]